jgi:hypothetical protein
MMEVTFHRRGERRYAIEVARREYPDVVMNPAPGYDDELPHDMIHFVVEQELGLDQGVFGQLSKGGDAGTFRTSRGAVGDTRTLKRARRKDDRRGDRLMSAGRDDTQLSEHAAVICEYEWRMSTGNAAQRREAEAMLPYVKRIRAELSRQELERLSVEVTERISDRLTRLSEEWKACGIGEGVTLEWNRTSTFVRPTRSR